ncbi:bifunctional methylenetetrahydrofolate dehydrogenase/methenyltetrahydrofolate cyclohydrolase FolD [Candidatus Bathyarchaeota archaeon]|nr:MAG: bifunctional methylenetetrahydrofolate dehydrogenase/methenyltetrahydrofolate cyclohydrolase FolD [Candidatus Bathyarchaeota archaeon]
MTATVMDGKLVAAEVKQEVSGRVKHLQQQGVRPWLSTVLVGDDPASETYLRAKHKACEEVGIKSENHHLPSDTPQDKLEALIDRLNHDDRVHGILVQLPLPKHLKEDRTIGKLDPDKDVDGLHPVNVGKLASGTEGLVPCTPKGVVRLLEHYKVQIAGSKAVIVNRSNLVGRPIAMLLLNRDATVTICHSKTKDLANITREADILVTAIGRLEVRIGPSYVKHGSTVVDVAINRVDGKLRGDIDFEPVSKIVQYITPVPGGVGPMTVAMLLENTVQAAALQAGIIL